MLMLHSTATDRCAELAHPNIPNFALTVFILAGILVSYIPQHLKIILRRSSAGLSPYFVLLGTTSSTCAVANIIVLPASRADIGCCRELGPFACAAGLLGIAQVGTQWSCFFVIMLLFLVFFPRQDGRDAAGPATARYRDALVVVAVSVTHMVATFIASVALYARAPAYLQLWANVLGVMAASLASVQYIPQLYTTWKLQAVLSLSIPMMCMQTPGSFLFAANLAVRLGIAGWSAWGVYIVTGCLQGCLLIMALVFRAREKGKGQLDGRAPAGGDEPDEPRDAVDERTPLVRP